MNLAGTTTLVSGGSTLVGKHVVDALRNYGEQRAIAMAWKIPIPGDSAGDLRNPFVALRLVKGCDVVIHASKSIMMGSNLIAAAVRYNVRKLIWIGAAAPPRPRRGRKLKILQLVPGEIYGPGGMFDPRFCPIVSAIVRRICDAARTSEEQVMLPGNEESVCDFLYVGDMAQAVLAACENDTDEKVLDVVSGTPHTLGEVGRRTAFLVQYRGRLLWTGGKLEAPPPSDPRRTAGAIGWLAGMTSLTEGLRNTVNWYNTVSPPGGKKKTKPTRPIKPIRKHPRKGR